MQSEMKRDSRYIGNDCVVGTLEDVTLLPRFNRNYSLTVQFNLAASRDLTTTLNV